jgi:ubiquinone/menaquinone biosynthesis C-methylase UbiE
MTATTPVPSPWTLGDFHVIGRMHNTGDALCDDCDVHAGSHVLDVACGSGNTALSAARRGANVKGLDLVDKLVERARVRAQAEGFDIEFRTGNAEELPYEDATFDYVLSTFGVMFAPDQQRAANELLRVCKPGGKIGLSNWTLESFPGTMFGIAAKYAPPNPQPHIPLEWGTASGINRLFAGHASRIRLLDRSFRWCVRDFDEWFGIMRTYFGPVKTLFDNLPEDRAALVRAELADATARYNRRLDDTLAIQMSYVNVIIER